MTSEKRLSLPRGRRDAIFEDEVVVDMPQQYTYTNRVAKTISFILWGRRSYRCAMMPYVLENDGRSTALANTITNDARFRMEWARLPEDGSFSGSHVIVAWWLERRPSFGIRHSLIGAIYDIGGSVCLLASDTHGAIMHKEK